MKIIGRPALISPPEISRIFFAPVFLFVDLWFFLAFESKVFKNPEQNAHLQKKEPTV